MKTFAHRTCLALMLALTSACTAAERVPLWKNGKADCAIVLPSNDPRAAKLGERTLKRYTKEFFGIELPVVRKAGREGTFIVVGTAENNSVVARLAKRGLNVDAKFCGDEGFRLRTFEDGKARFIVISGNTPRALKHGCHELLFYHVAAKSSGGAVEWPMDITMRPRFAYRGIYMLPCWAQHDSIESWKRMLQFNSELTLNRIWFWLDGFPVAGHPAVSHVPDRTNDYATTPLASDRNVQELIDFANGDEMKFYIGGGWMSWHHGQVVGKDVKKAREFYLAYLKQLKGVGGFYFEPTGEGSESSDWRHEAESLCDFIRDVTASRRGFEAAIAIGHFNNTNYLRVMARLDPRRVFWWWCWGNPFKDEPQHFYPSVLGWHTVVPMSAFHGSTSVPGPEGARLAGIATSYDPGMGFGNPWNGYATLGGAPGPRNFHPRTMPYFSHEYRFREDCWNENLTDEEFERRLSRRLFDSDMPRDSIRLYLSLAKFCFAPKSTDAKALAELESFVSAHRDSGTPRNRDTLSRMAEALEGLRRVAAKR